MNVLPDRICDYFIISEYGKKKPIILSRFPLEDHTDSSFPSEIHLFCFPYKTSEFLPSTTKMPFTHSFVLTGSDGTKIYGVSLIYTYKQKCRSICISSHWPFYSRFEEFLIVLYERFCTSPEHIVYTENDFLPLERILSNYVFEVPLPPRGQKSVIVSPFSYFSQKFFRPEINKLADLYLHKKLLYDSMTPDTMLKTLSAILLERKILFYSQHLNKLTNICEIFYNLTFPLYWRYVYIPIVPRIFYDFLMAPMPFIYGIHKSNIPSNLDEEIVCIDLDINDVHCLNNNEMPPLPGNAADKLRRDLVAHFKLPLADRNLKILQEIFLNFFIKLLKNYYSCIHLHTESFNAEKFKSNFKPKDMPFLNLFTKTQMFNSFIDEVIANFKDNDSTDIKIYLFNEHVKNSTQHASDFLIDSSMAHIETYKCPPPSNIALNIEITYKEHKTIPLISKKFILPPRQKSSLTSKEERNSFKVGVFSNEFDYFQNKILSNKVAARAKYFTRKQNCQFNSLIRFLKVYSNLILSISDSRMQFGNKVKGIKVFNTGESLDRYWNYVKKETLRITNKNLDLDRKLMRVVGESIEELESLTNETNVRLNNFSSLDQLIVKEKVHMETLEKTCKLQKLIYEEKKEKFIQGKSITENVLRDYSFVKKEMDIYNENVKYSNYMQNKENRSILFHILCNHYYQNVIEINNLTQENNAKRIRSVQSNIEEIVDCQIKRSEMNSKYYTALRDRLEEMSEAQIEKLAKVQSNLPSTDFISNYDIFDEYEKGPMSELEFKESDWNNLYFKRLWGKNGMCKLLKEIKKSKRDIHEYRNFILNKTSILQMISLPLQTLLKAIKRPKFTTPILEKFLGHVSKYLSSKIANIEILKDRFIKVSKELTLLKFNLKCASESSIKTQSLNNSYIESKQIILNSAIHRSAEVERKYRMSVMEMQSFENSFEKNSSKKDELVDTYADQMNSMNRNALEKIVSEQSVIQEENILKIAQIREDLFMAHNFNFLQKMEKERYLTLQRIFMGNVWAEKKEVNGRFKEIAKILDKIEHADQSLFYEAYTSIFGIKKEEVPMDDSQIEFLIESMFHKKGHRCIEKVEERKDQALKEAIFISSTFQRHIDLSKMYIGKIEKMRSEDTNLTAESSQYLNSCIMNEMIQFREIFIYFNKNSLLKMETFLTLLNKSIKNFNSQAQMYFDSYKKVRSDLESLEKRYNLTNKEIFLHKKVIDKSNDRKLLSNFKPASSLQEEKEISLTKLKKLKPIKLQLSKEKKNLTESFEKEGILTIKKFILSELILTRSIMDFIKNFCELEKHKIEKCMDFNSQNIQSFRKMSRIVDGKIFLEKFSGSKSPPLYVYNFIKNYDPETYKLVKKRRMMQKSKNKDSATVSGANTSEVNEEEESDEIFILMNSKSDEKDVKEEFMEKEKDTETKEIIDRDREVISFLEVLGIDQASISNFY